MNKPKYQKHVQICHSEIKVNSSYPHTA